MTWTFHPLTRADFALLAGWLADPDVHRYWHHEWTPEALERDFGATIDGAEPGEDLVAELAGRPVGLVQRSRVADWPDERAGFEAIVGPVDPQAVQLDYLVGGGSDRGRGVGPAMIDAVARQTFAAYPAVPYLLAAVVAGHRRSWLALEKAGFRRIGSGDMPPDNPVDPPLHHVLRRDRE